jgi:hypothetical protein
MVAMKISMNSRISSQFVKALFCIFIYFLHLVAIYAITSYFRATNIFITVGFLVSVVFLCLSCIVGWLVAADDFREAFVRFKKTPPDKEPPGEFTVFAPMRFCMAVILWPYLMLFGDADGRQDSSTV